MLKYRPLLLSVILIGVMVVGCDKPSANQTTTSQRGSTEPLPSGLFLTQAPEKAAELIATRETAKDGDAVVVRARVGGRQDPFSADRAVMTVADTSLLSCDKMPGDTCETPWDYCCDDPASLAKAIASVQVVGSDGKPLRATLKNVSGIAPLKEVVIVGTLRKSPDGKAATINANGIFVKS